MGSVFLARDTRLGRRVAIKFLHTNSPELTQRFILEARTTARCSHENIVIIYEVDAFRGLPFMVLEYLQGKTLAETLKKGQRVPAPRAVELMVPVVRALVCAHEQGIVHRDLKPANILITDSGTIKVLDFGIAKVLQAENESLGLVNEVRQKQATAETAVGLQRAAGRAALDPENSNIDTGELTRHGAIMGTLPFMAPEQWRAGTPIDHRADIWAVGIILFRLLSGKHPLDPLVGEQLFVTGILNEPMPKLRTKAPDIPQGLADVVDRCLMKRKEERMPDALSLLRALEPFLPGRFRAEGDLSENQSPYAGLASFQEADADRFFGRTREIAAMVNRIADRPIIGVVGTSGAGKSSFVRAGLVPALKRSGEAWEALVIRPGRKPLAALADIVAPMVTTSTSVADDLKAREELIQRLRTEPGYVGTVLRSRARHEKKRILLFIDQFEELYTLVPDESERMAFTACLAGIADDATAPTRVVLSIRSDFLDRAAEDQAFMAELAQGLFFLNAPDRAGLRDALVQPAEMAGYKFETQDMVEHMLDHLEETPGALPLLQFAATQLWERRDPARKMLTRQSYDAIGGIAGALASHADAVLQELPENGRKLARAVLLRLVTPERTRAIVSLEELRELSRDGAEVQRLVDQLVQARLLVVQKVGGGGGTVEIVHESLIHSWPTLRRWLEENQEDAVFLEQLRNAARQWAGKGRDKDLLWRGEVVEEARRFQRRFRGELPEVQRAFLQAVFAEAARAARRKQALTIGAGVFLVLLLVAATVALVVIRKAQRAAEIQAIAAHNAEAVAKDAAEEAKRRLIEVQAKEAERRAAQAKAEEAAKRAEEAKAELEKKNIQLLAAFQRAEEAKQRATWAKLHSERSAAEARQAREEAVEAAKELQALLAREQERVKRLQSQLGSPVIETLK
ncbi:MAG: protein kinase [Myxococcaceae bacterium]|nr:protein kinase [Myxococcaceae bacterium]